MQLPTWECYCENTTKANALVFDLGNGVAVYYSYKTPVAFRTPESGMVCRENEWGPTTGKHLNAIEPDKKARIDGEAFELALEAELSR